MGLSTHWRYIIEAINAKAGREMIGYAGKSSEE